MAAALAALAVPSAVVASAGTTSVGGMAASEGAMWVMAERDIDLRAHRSRTLDDAFAGGVDLIVVMTARHHDDVVRRFPDLAGRVTLLRPDGEDVADPYGSALDDYRRARDEIATAIAARAPEWQALGGNTAS